MKITEEGGEGGGGGGGSFAPYMTVEGAERYIENLQEFKIEEVGSSRYVYMDGCGGGEDVSSCRLTRLY